jgi:hypothetical protein
VVVTNVELKLSTVHSLIMRKLGISKKNNLSTEKLENALQITKDKYQVLNSTLCSLDGKYTKEKRIERTCTECGTDMMMNKLTMGAFLCELAPKLFALL